jgi:hypothetical protein
VLVVSDVQQSLLAGVLKFFFVETTQELKEVGNCHVADAKLKSQKTNVHRAAQSPE